LAQSLYEKIEQKAIDDAQKILKAGEVKAQAAMAAALAAAEARNAELLAKTQEKNLSLRKTQTTELEQAERQELLTLKKSLIDRVQADVAQKMQTLPDPDWVAFVVGTLAADELRGGETIVPSALDRPRFLTHFSSGESTPEGILLRKLSRQLPGNPDLILSPKNAPISGGFLVEGTDFDIDHSHQTLLLNIKEKYESELATILFAPRE
jgi:vacuolar-type H+-ATPase subunit E/Vma4